MRNKGLYFCKGMVMKSKKIRWIEILIMAGLILGVGNKAFVEASQETEVSETESDESEIVPGERTTTIMVVSITGNEMTYYEVQEEPESEKESETETQKVTEEESESANTKDKMSPRGMNQDGENMTPPEGMTQDGGTMTPPGEMQQDGGDMPSGDFQKGERSEVQNDTKTVYLPVPVVVHTDTDERRTFSILEAGDRLQVTIVTDEEGNETITEIWMLGE